MASLEQRGQRYRIVFRYGGRKFQHPLKTTEEGEARSCLARLEENLRLLERGRLTLPPGADLPTFLISDGQLNGKPKVPEVLTLQTLYDRYREAHGHGALEQNSLDTAAMHLRHFLATLGPGFSLGTLSLTDLQGHVNRRAKEKGIHGSTISPTTLRKEMASLRAAWNWAVSCGFLHGAFPGRGLRYPKADEKQPFQTWTEIERQVAHGGLTPAEERELWDRLFLTLPEIDELLAYQSS